MTVTDPYELPVLESPQPWVRDAACRGMGPEQFFPTRGETTAPAKAACSGCPVRFECLEYSLEGAGEKHGIWGGVSERERRRLRRTRRAAAGFAERGPIPSRAS